MTQPTHVTLDDRWQLWRLAALRSAGLPVEMLASWRPDVGSTPTDRAAASRDAADASRQAAARFAGHAPFVEAVVWQNPQLVRNWLGDYHARLVAAKDDPQRVPLARRSSRETDLARLAQRYCAKNETIGFFGPVAWASFDTAAPCPFTVRGAGGLRSRTLYVEGWVAVELAERLAEDDRVAANLPLRRNPLEAVLDGIVYRPRRPPRPADTPADAVAARLAAPATAHELSARCAGLEDADFDAALAELLAERRVVRGIAVPIDDDPLRRVIDAVAALPAGPAAREWSARLERVTRALDGVRVAAGAPAALLAALDTLRAAGADGAVRGSRTDAAYGRAQVYEDCRRDLDVTVGADLLADLRAPLGLLLDTADWLVGQIGEEVRGDLVDRYRDLRARSTAVSLSDLLLACGDVLGGTDGSAVHRVSRDFDARWAELLAMAGADGRLRTDLLRPLADALFPRSGGLRWQAAHQHSPDLMLRAAAGRARPQWVLGELHLALNTLENRPFVTQADDPDLLRAASRRDYPAGRIVAMFPRSSPEVTSRTYPPIAIDLPDHYDYWSYADDDGHPAGARCWPGPALQVHEDGGDLVAELPGTDGVRRPVLEFFGEFLTTLAVDRFQLRAPAPHLPRLLLDDVVIERESWLVEPGDVPGEPGEPTQRPVAAWLTALGCPQHVFVKAPGERKPFLVDLAAPRLLRGLVRAAERETRREKPGPLRIVEMLPGPDELVVQDAAGCHYTSELRAVAVRGGRDDSVAVRIGTRIGTPT